MFNILAVVQRNQTRGMAREAWTRLDRVGLDNGDSISGRGILRFGNPRGFSFLVSAPKWTRNGQAAELDLALHVYFQWIPRVGSYELQ